MNIERSDIVSSNRGLFFDTWKAWQAKLSYFSIFAALPGVALLPLVDTNAQEPMIDAGAAPASKAEGDPRVRMPRRSFPVRGRHVLDYQKGGTNIVEPLSGTDNCPGLQIPAGTYTHASPYIDSGDTTGANNTVNRPHYIHYGYYWHNTPGLDHVYTLTLTARGPNAQIEVSRTAGTYEPQIYILDGRYGCPAGTVQNAFNELVWAAPAAGTGIATLAGELEYVPMNIPLHLFVDSEFTDARGSGAYTLKLKDVTVAPTVAVQRTKFDFDGDGRSDISVFRPGEQKWYIDRSTGGLAEHNFGLETDRIAPADYDGDNKNDIAVYRDGMWWWIRSSDSTPVAVHWGTTGDVPVPADYNGDGRAELVVFRNGRWYVFDPATGNVSENNFGVAGDRPVVADYDNDGRADQAIYRGGVWHINRSNRGYLVVQWGVATDIPVPGDYDADGKPDFAIYRNGNWWVLWSLYGYYSGGHLTNWGLSTDTPVPADYDGDGRTEVAVYRDGVWYIQHWDGQTTYRSFGLAGDKPLQSAFLP